MTEPFILASGSAIRAQLLSNAAVPFSVQVARVDEDGLTQALLAEGASARDIADALAESKARKVSGKAPGALVLGCDQVLEVEHDMLSKPRTPEEALDQLRRLSSKTHRLLSAAVIYKGGEPLWRHVGQVRLTMHSLSEEYLRGYVRRNWDSIRHAVGAYKLEEEGARLFARIDGDTFNVLGMPLLEILAWLANRGVIDR